MVGSGDGFSSIKTTGPSSVLVSSGTGVGGELDVFEILIWCRQQIMSNYENCSNRSEVLLWSQAYI